MAKLPQACPVQAAGAGAHAGTQVPAWLTVPVQQVDPVVNTFRAQTLPLGQSTLLAQGAPQDETAWPQTMLPAALKLLAV